MSLGFNVNSNTRELTHDKLDISIARAKHETKVTVHTQILRNGQLRPIKFDLMFGSQKTSTETIKNAIIKELFREATLNNIIDANTDYVVSKNGTITTGKFVGNEFQPHTNQVSSGGTHKSLFNTFKTVFSSNSKNPELDFTNYSKPSVANSVPPPPPPPPLPNGIDENVNGIDENVPPPPPLDDFDEDEDIPPPPPPLPPRPAVRAALEPEAQEVEVEEEVDTNTYNDTTSTYDSNEVGEEDTDNYSDTSSFESVESPPSTPREVEIEKNTMRPRRQAREVEVQTEAPIEQTSNKRNSIEERLNYAIESRMVNNRNPLFSRRTEEQLIKSIETRLSNRIPVLIKRSNKAVQSDDDKEKIMEQKQILKSEENRLINELKTLILKYQDTYGDNIPDDKQLQLEAFKAKASEVVDKQLTTEFERLSSFE